tara:strand:- start:102 stop:812 length:711 start_codon:yes stop_codon:yes gene_type:complete
MIKLTNWDNQTWLSSSKYILEFNKFLEKKVSLNKQTKILDIGCGRAKIIGSLQTKYKFNNRPIGVDIVKNKGIKNNIFFERIDGINFCRKYSKKFDLILIKQTIHFFSLDKINILLRLSKKRLAPRGKLLIFFLKTKNNKIPCFKKMREKLYTSLKRDERLIKIIKKKLGKTRTTNFNFKVKISTNKYLSMIKSRYISCLVNMDKREIDNGVIEIREKYGKKIKFTDSLKCILFRK